MTPRLMMILWEIIRKVSRERANAVEIDFGNIGHLRPLAVTRPLRSLAVTCGHWVGLVGHLLQRPLAATCGHSSGCKWLQVAASGCK